MNPIDFRLLKIAGILNLEVSVDSKISGTLKGIPDVKHLYSNRTLFFLDTKKNPDGSFFVYAGHYGDTVTNIRCPRLKNRKLLQLLHV
jgi:hypothetical protein